MAIDFINTYVPAFVELTPEEIADCRIRLETFARTMFPDVDTSPNTVIGDLVLTPQAHQVAALEKGLDRFMSDLDLGNVANNEIYNCDFVARYLNNFAVNTSYEAQSSGVVRLVFDTDKDYTLDRGTQFKIGEYIFTLYLPHNGPFTIKKVGTVPADTENGATLIDSGSNAYFVDVPVLGHEPDVDVSSGTSVEVSVVIPELGAATTLVNFNKGVEVNTLSELAKRARATMHSASLNTRSGAIRYVESTCPFVDSVYAIRSGDPEMLRGRNEFGVGSGCLDVYARSKSYAFEESQTVRLYYNSVSSSFEGKFNYVGQPYYIDSITCNGVDQDNIEHTVIAVNTAGLGARGAYTNTEDLYLQIPDQKVKSDSIFNPSIDDRGRKYVNFRVNYHTDPLLPSIAATLKNEDYTPVNVDLQCRGFIPVVIKKFNVRYVKTPGVVPDLVTADKEIRSYFDGIGAPDAYADSEISRIMREAGVKYMAGIDVYATVQWSLGDYITPLGKTTLAEATEKTKTNTIVTTSQGLRLKYPGNQNAAVTDVYACSIRNTRYYMLDTAVAFTEVKEM